MHRVILIFSLIIFFFLPAIILSILPPQKKQIFFRFVYKIIRRILRVNVKVTGDVAKQKPILFTSNHMSYLDIIVLGSILPGNFVSKAEVAQWPIIGWAAKLGGTIFVNRKRSKAGSHLSFMIDALDSGKNLILFPEGTTGNGIHVLPFKSSLFKLAEERDITIQPITLKYKKINGLPVQSHEKAKISWIGDEGFAPHIKDFAKLGKVEAEIIIHPPIEKLNNRKKIAEECHKAVSGSYN